MIAEVKDARETDRGIPGLVPVAVLVLAVDQVCNAASDGWMAGLTGRHQSGKSPRSLRRSALRRIAVGPSRPIGFAAFSPPPVVVLASDKPIDGAPHLGRIFRQTGAVQRGEPRPSPVDIVGAPSAEPAAGR